MKTATVILSAAIISLMLGACNGSSSKSEHSHEHSDDHASQVYNLDTAKLKPGDRFYQCEMHHEVISDKAGHCPKCDMDLMEIKKK